MIVLAAGYRSFNDVTFIVFLDSTLKSLIKYEILQAVVHLSTNCLQVFSGTRLQIHHPNFHAIKVVQ